MPYTINGLGAGSSGSVTTTPTVALPVQTVNRSAALLCNTDATKRLYVALSSDFYSGPTINSTVHQFSVPPLTTTIIGAGKCVAVWIAAESGTVNFTFTEVQF